MLQNDACMVSDEVSLLKCGPSNTHFLHASHSMENRFLVMFIAHTPDSLVGKTSTCHCRLPEFDVVVLNFDRWILLTDYVRLIRVWGKKISYDQLTKFRKRSQ